MLYDPLTLWPNVIEAVVIGASIIIGMRWHAQVIAEAIHMLGRWRPPVE